MNNLGPPKIDLTKLLSSPTVHSINGTTVDPIKLMNNVSMVSMKINSDNVDEVKAMTTEGYSKEERILFIQSIRERLNSDIF